MTKFKILLLALCFASTTFAAVDNKVIVEYKNGPLTANDIKKKMSELWGIEDVDANPNKSFEQLNKTDKENLIKHVIVTDIIVEKAKRKNTQNSPIYKSQLKRDETNFLQQIYLQEIAQQEITEEKLKARYQEIVKAKSNDGEEIKARHILVDTEEEAKQILDLIKTHKKTFVELAKEKSKDPGSKNLGGELNYFVHGQMVKPFEEAAFNLKINEISKPVKSPFGWHIIELLDRRKVVVAAYQDLKEEIKNELEDEIARNYIQEVIKEANIKFKF